MVNVSQGKIEGTFDVLKPELFLNLEAVLESSAINFRLFGLNE